MIHVGGSAVLEVIDKGSGEGAPPLLFVHGAWHGAWCWDDHFLDFFADRGFRALALSLRGHGKSSTDKRLSLCSIADYVADVRSVAQTLPTPPVLIGHSMGGLVVQKYLESENARAAVLLASVPPRGLTKALLGFSRRHPWLSLKGLVTGDSTVGLRTPALVRELFFSPGTPEDVVARCAERVQQESLRALYVDATLTAVPKPDRVATPLLVLGGEHDVSFTVGEVLATGRAYGTEAEVFSEMGHNMMLEPGWRDVAERIAAWLNTELIPRRS